MGKGRLLLNARRAIASAVLVASALFGGACGGAASEQQVRAEPPKPPPEAWHGPEIAVNGARPPEWNLVVR